MLKRQIFQNLFRLSPPNHSIKWINILFVCSNIFLISKESLAADSSNYSSLDTNSKEFFKPSQIIKNCHKIVEEISSAYKLEDVSEKKRNKAQKKINKEIYNSLKMLYGSCPFFAFHHPTADAFCKTSYKGGEYICRIDTPPFQLFTGTPPLTFCYQGIKRLLASFEFEPTLYGESPQASSSLSSQKSFSPAYMKLKNLYSHTTANEVIYNIIYAYLNILSTYLPTPQEKNDLEKEKTFITALEEYQTKVMTELHNLYNREEKNHSGFKEFILKAGLPHDYNNKEVKNPRLFKLSQDKNLNASLFKQKDISSSCTANISFSFGKVHNKSIFSDYLPSSAPSPLLHEWGLRVKENLLNVLEAEGKGKDLTENYSDIMHFLSFYRTHAEKFGFLLQMLLAPSSKQTPDEKCLTSKKTQGYRILPLKERFFAADLKYNLDAKLSSEKEETPVPSTPESSAPSPLAEAAPSLPKTASTIEEALERQEALIKEEGQRKINRNKSFPKRTSKKKGKATIKKENKQGVSPLSEENSPLASVSTAKKTEEKTDLLLPPPVYYPERISKEEQEWQTAGKKSSSSRKEDALGKTSKLVVTPKTPEKKEKTGLSEKAKRSLSSPSQEATDNSVLKLPKKDRKEPALASTPPRPLSSSTPSPQTSQKQTPRNSKSPLSPQQQQTREKGALSPATPPKILAKQSSAELIPVSSPTASFTPFSPPLLSSPSLPVIGAPSYFPFPVPPAPEGLMAVPTLIPPPDAVNIATTEGVETYVRIKKAFFNHTTQEYDTSQEIRELVHQSPPFP